MISRNRTFVTVYLAGACEKRPHTVLSLNTNLQGLQPNVQVSETQTHVTEIHTETAHKRMAQLTPSNQHRPAAHP